VPVPAEVEVEPPAPEYPEPGRPAIEAPMSLCDGRDSEEHPAAIARVIASVSRGARGPAVIDKQSGRRVTGRVNACKHKPEDSYRDASGSGVIVDVDVIVVLDANMIVAALGNGNDIVGVVDLA
jgi:hypothetical protein